MEIGTRKIKESIVNELIKNIKKKKELIPLADSFVKDILKEYLAQNPKKIKFLNLDFTQKSSKYKEIIKEVRKELRKVHLLFKINNKDRNKLINKPQELLKTHSSTNERISFYESIYHKIFQITGKPKTILDLGCGLNPFSFPLMKIKPTYYAYDINEEEINLIKNYFQLNKIKGKAEILNLFKIKKLPKADVCFLWKITDVLERGKGHKITENLIKKIKAKFIIISFPTYTVKGVPMNQPRRRWVKLMCERLKLDYKIFKEENEIFYLIKQSL